MNTKAPKLFLLAATVIATAASLLYLFILSPSIGPPPYAPSQYQITFDQSSVTRLAPGSDNWAVTWADDNNQYAPWGDGGGFGGTNKKGRVSLGIARIEGNADDYKGFNVWGGLNPENTSTIDGKSYGLLSIEGVFYMWTLPGSGEKSFEEARLYTSTDHAKSWTRQDWAFSKNDAIISPTFLQFGKDYQGARDEFVYVFAPRLKDGTASVIQRPGQIDLMRVPRKKLTDRSQYRFYSGSDKSGKPQWTKELSKRSPVFADINGVGWSVSVSYNAGLDRYFLITEHTETVSGHIGIHDAPEPWGPWTTVVYDADLAGLGPTFFWNFSNKWLSRDGRDFVLIFTGIKANDTWGTISGSLRLRAQDL